MKQLPYVVSADIYLLLKKWTKQSNFILPSDIFFSQLRASFFRYMENIFVNFDFVSEAEILSGLNELVDKDGLPTISLDSTYFHGDLKFDIARLVDRNGNSKGLGHRANTSSIFRQIKEIKEFNITRVAIVDDVLFSGEVLERVINLLNRINIEVPFVYVGIGIRDGIERLSHDKCQVHCVRSYDGVIDEVCERDFYPGVPFSGRLLNVDNNIGVPYILPFGDPVNWASIPTEKALSFSKFCLQQSICLFEKIELCSNREIYCRDLPRQVVGLQQPGARYVTLLRDML